MTKTNYLIGTDPEMFLTLGGKAVSAHGLFPGTKHDPYPVDKGAVQVDGLALEFNIDPAETEDEFVKNIATVLTQIDEMIKEVDPDMQRVFTPFMEFDAKYFATIPDEAKILGCDPDYSGRTGKRKSPPEIGDEPFRTAAGHIHIGWDRFLDVTDPAHNEDCRFVSHTLSYILPTIVDYSDENCRRLKYYGGHAAYRPKSYGVEIRFPSNAWLKTENSRRLAYRDVMKGMSKIEQMAPKAA